MAVARSEDAAIHPAAAAREGEPIVVKHRTARSLDGIDLIIHHQQRAAPGIDVRKLRHEFSLQAMR